MFWNLIFGKECIYRGEEVEADWLVRIDADCDVEPLDLAEWKWTAWMSF